MEQDIRHSGRLSGGQTDNTKSSTQTERRRKTGSPLADESLGNLAADAGLCVPWGEVIGVCVCAHG